MLLIVDDITNAIRLDDSRRYTEDEIFCLARPSLNKRLFICFEAGLKTRILDEDELSLASRMMCLHHNDLYECNLANSTKDEGRWNYMLFDNMLRPVDEIVEGKFETMTSIYEPCNTTAEESDGGESEEDSRTTEEPSNDKDAYGVSERGRQPRRTRRKGREYAEDDDFPEYTRSSGSFVYT